MAGTVPSIFNESVWRVGDIREYFEKKSKFYQLEKNLPIRLETVLQSRAVTIIIFIVLRPSKYDGVFMVKR